jgi:hypothetical protein
MTNTINTPQGPAAEYADFRRVEYPSIQQQLDMQYWDAVNGTTTWQDAIAEIKNKYPKPTGDNE